MKMMDQDLIEMGYKELHLDTDFLGYRIFQKRFYDGPKEKYTINVRKWEPVRCANTGEILFQGSDYSSQLFRDSDHARVDIGFTKEWHISEVEEYMESLWDTGLWDYYKEFGG